MKQTEITNDAPAPKKAVFTPDQRAIECEGAIADIRRFITEEMPERSLRGVAFVLLWADGDEDYDDCTFLGAGAAETALRSAIVFLRENTEKLPS